jgi:large subunit ribosomal protein L3
MNTNPGLLGRKLGMTQFFDDEGKIVPCTVVELGPCVVTQVKTVETDGYSAIQLGFAPQKAQRLTKAQAGHFAKAGTAPRKVLRELRMNDVSGYTAGQEITLGEIFSVGQKVDATGTSKGRGFAGVMKRHNMAGFIRSHGTHEFFRHGGSIGTRLTPGHVQKGMKMPGQMGNKRVTVQNLTVAKIDTENNLLFIRGGIPGANGRLCLVRGGSKGQG